MTRLIRSKQLVTPCLALLLTLATGGLAGCGREVSFGRTDIRIGGGDQDRSIGPGSFDPCAGKLNDTLAYPRPSLSKPAVGQTVVDPALGGRITRITDIVTEAGGSAIRPLYATVGAWNADESRLLLYAAGIAHRLYNGQDYRFIKNLPALRPADVEQVYWHPSDATSLYYIDVGTGELVRYNIDTDVGRAVHQFACGSNSKAPTAPTPPSADGDLWVHLCSDGAGTTATTYRLTNDTESDSITVADSPRPAVSSSGTAILLGRSIYSSDLTLRRTLDLAAAADFSAMGRLADGTEILNAVAFDAGPQGSGVGTVVVHHLENSLARVVMGPSSGFPYPGSRTVISAMATALPGWLITTGGSDGNTPFAGELVLVHSAASGRFCRIAHHRSSNGAGAAGTWSVPHASFSPSGRRIVFASDWLGDTADVYVVDL